MSQILYSLLSIVLLYLLIVTFCYFLLRSNKKDIVTNWSTILSLLNSRLDKIPALLEIYKEYDNNSKYLADLISLRNKALSFGFPDSKRFDDEQLISSLLKPIINNINSNKILKSNIILQTYLKEYSSSLIDLNLAVDKYNKKISDYNKIIRFPLFKFFFRLIGLKEEVCLSI